MIAELTDADVKIIADEVERRMVRTFSQYFVPRNMDISETAKFLGVSESHIYRLVNEDGIPYCRVGKKLLRFDPVKLKTWMESR